MAEGDVDVKNTSNNGKSCAIFDGVNDKVTVTIKDSLRPRRQLSISCWALTRNITAGNYDLIKE
jgi:hypothetical protein